jgi:hypothetical protein
MALATHGFYLPIAYRAARATANPEGIDIGRKSGAGQSKFSSGEKLISRSGRGAR